MIEAVRWHAWRVRFHATEKVSKAIADALPRKVVFFVAIRLWSHAVTNPYSTDATRITMDEVIQRWEDMRRGTEQ